MKKKLSTIEGKKFIIGNWKMSLSIQDSRNLSCELLNHLQKNELKRTVIGVIPSFLSIPDTVKTFENTNAYVGSQNVAFENKGAFTGEVSAVCLKELGVDFCLVGHSERRNFFGDTNESSAQRAYRAVENNLTVIFCLGENLAQRQDNLTNIVLEAQLKPLIEHLPPQKWVDIFIAYEPMWAIGTGKVASNEQIENTHSFIKNYLKEKDLMPKAILYGGSVNIENIKDILSLHSVDGALVGGASQNLETFGKIIQISEDLN